MRTDENRLVEARTMAGVQDNDRTVLLEDIGNYFHCQCNTLSHKQRSETPRDTTQTSCPERLRPTSLWHMSSVCLNPCNVSLPDLSHVRFLVVRTVVIGFRVAEAKGSMDCVAHHSNHDCSQDAEEHDDRTV